MMLLVYYNKSLCIHRLRLKTGKKWERRGTARRCAKGGKEKKGKEKEERWKGKEQKKETRGKSIG